MPMQWQTWVRCMHRAFCGSRQGESTEWYEKSLKAMLIVEGRKENTYLEYRIGKMYQYGLGTEENSAGGSRGLGWHQV